MFPMLNNHSNSIDSKSQGFSCASNFTRLLKRFGLNRGDSYARTESRGWLTPGRRFCHCANKAPRLSNKLYAKCPFFSQTTTQGEVWSTFSRIKIKIVTFLVTSAIIISLIISLTVAIIISVYGVYWPNCLSI